MTDSPVSCWVVLKWILFEMKSLGSSLLGKLLLLFFVVRFAHSLLPNIITRKSFTWMLPFHSFSRKWCNKGKACKVNYGLKLCITPSFIFFVTEVPKKPVHFSKSMDWFLYDRDLRRERITQTNRQNFSLPVDHVCQNERSATTKVYVN